MTRNHHLAISSHHNMNELTRSLHALAWAVLSLFIQCPFSSSLCYSIFSFWGVLMTSLCRHSVNRSHRTSYHRSCRTSFALSLSNYVRHFGVFLTAFSLQTSEWLRYWSTYPARDQCHLRYQGLPGASRYSLSGCDNTRYCLFFSTWDPHSSQRWTSLRSVPIERSKRRRGKTTTELQGNRRESGRKATSIADVLPGS